VNSVCIFVSLFGANDGSSKASAAQRMIVGNPATAKQEGRLYPEELYKLINEDVDITAGFKTWAKMGEKCLDGCAPGSSGCIVAQKEKAHTFVMQVKAQAKFLGKQSFSSWFIERLKEHPQKANITQFLITVCQEQGTQSKSFIQPLPSAQQSAGSAAAAAASAAVASAVLANTAASAGAKKQDKSKN